MKLSFHHRVQGEVNEATTWYEDQNPGLGGTFAKAVLATLEVIQKRPEGFGFFLGSKTVRRSGLKRFPYDVLYEVRPDRIRILCLRHRKRHPGYGQRRR